MVFILLNNDLSNNKVKKEEFMNQRLFGIYLMIAVSVFGTMFEMQGSIFKEKQPKKQNAAQIKMELVENLQDLLSQVTQSIRHMTSLIDDIVVRGKELAGQQDGLLSTNEKEALKTYQKKVCDLQVTLQCLECQLKVV